MRRYGWDYAEDLTGRNPPRRRRRRSPAQAWLAEPIEGRVGHDRLYGDYRGARYGDRYDLGFAPLSEMNPVSRQLEREYHGLAPGSWRRACPPWYDGDY